MANLPETPQWEDGIYQIEVSDPVVGGPDGISNRQARQLASRTSYLKQKVEKGGKDLDEHIKAADPHTQYAQKESPVFTGIPKAPTAPAGNNTTQLATTAFVQATLKALINGAPATLDTLKEIAAAINNDPKFSTTINNALALKAPLSSPALTGTPTAPTAAQSVNNTQIATTAFVKSAIAAMVASAPAALDTLNELAAALGNNPNFATTMTNALAGKQPADATLTALAALATSADRLPYFTGVDRAALTALTSVGRAILGKTSTQGVLDYLGLGEGSALPVGVPVPWPTATPPAGWLQCNGASFTKEQYPVLARAYPNLRLPDLRGEFIRGWDDGRKADSGRTILSTQGWLTGSHYHNILAWDAWDNSVLMPNDKMGDGLLSTDNAIQKGAINGRFTSQYRTESSGGNETRPRNVAFNYIVRAV